MRYVVRSRRSARLAGIVLGSLVLIALGCVPTIPPCEYTVIDVYHSSDHTMTAYYFMYRCTLSPSGLAAQVRPYDAGWSEEPDDDVYAADNAVALAIRWEDGDTLHIVENGGRVGLRKTTHKWVHITYEVGEQTPDYSRISGIPSPSELEAN